MEERTILRTEALAVGYQRTAVVQGITMTAQSGKVLSLIGPNGAGKSTILKTLLRLLPPVSGSIWLCGRELNRMSDREAARTVAAVLTERPEPEQMRCEDVISAGRYPYTGRLGILSHADREKVRRVMEQTETLELRDRDFRQISDGQRQRVLLARAICQEPKLLVLDEPTSFLDIRHKLDFMHLLRKLAREEKMAVVLSLHELDLAQKFSDTVMTLRNGTVDRCAPPEAVFAGDYIQRLFDVERGSFDSDSGSAEPAPAEGSPLVFVIAGGGSGLAVYRKLQRLGIPFAAGVLQENDRDLPVARTLAARVITERAYEPIGEESLEQAKDALRQCEAAVCCTKVFGTENRANARLAAFAREQGLLLEGDPLEALERRF